MVVLMRCRVRGGAGEHEDSEHGEVSRHIRFIVPGASVGQGVERAPVNADKCRQYA